MSALEKTNPGELDRTPTMYEQFAQMARDPTIDVDRLAKLMDLFAEREFTAAFARLKFPPIAKHLSFGPWPGWSSLASFKFKLL